MGDEEFRSFQPHREVWIGKVDPARTRSGVYSMPNEILGIFDSPRCASIQASRKAESAVISRLDRVAIVICHIGAGLEANQDLSPPIPDSVVSRPSLAFPFLSVDKN